MIIKHLEEIHDVEISGDGETQRISWTYDREREEFHLFQRPSRDDWTWEEMDSVTIPKEQIQSLRDYLRITLNGYYKI